MFVTDGYNFRNTELSAVLGTSQLKRLDKYIEKRNKNYFKFTNLIKEYSSKFVIPEYSDFVSNFCFPLLCKDRHTAQFLRSKFDENGIEHRPIIGGNLLKQPFLNVDFVHYNGIYLGNNHFIDNKEIQLLNSILEKL
jgi:CDP-6-deoxy-D-xylo-4-hexulose-3-dehydrase